MSYQKSVALLCCAFLFSTLVPELIKASTSEATNWVSTEVAERTSTPESKSVTNGTPSDAPNTLPPDDEGPVITATPPADVVLYGCHADFTYSEGAMGKPDFNVTDDCGTVVVVSTYVDDYAYCAEADDDQPEGGLVITRTFTIDAEDCYENTSTLSVVQTITVLDNNLPSFVEALPNDTTVNCETIPAPAVLTASDTCDSDVRIDYTQVVTNNCDLTRTWVATDDCGNSITHVQLITVEDLEPPVITGTPSDISQGNDVSMCSAVVAWTEPTATDNCALKSFGSDHEPGDTFPEGTTLVTYTAVDSCGNVTTTSFNVIISDEEDPILTGVPSDIAQNNDLDFCGALVTWTPPTSTDNCPGDTLTSTHEPGDYFEVGETIVSYTATDSTGNDTTATFTVTISDAQIPAILGLPSDISVSAGADSCGTVVQWTAPTSTDNCPDHTFTSNHDSGDVFEVGTTTVTYTATDASGNDSIASFTIEVSDDQNPNINDLPADITLTAELDSCSAIATWSAPSAMDNCDMDTLYASHASGDYFPVGTTTVTYTALDIHGNDSLATFTVTITDDQDPMLIGMPTNIVQTMDEGDCGAVVTWTPPTVDENCSQTMTSTHNPGETFGAGPTTVTYYSIDPAGGADTASFTITTTDDEAPVILGTPGDISADTDAGVCTAVVTWTPPTATDNCGQTLTSSHESGDTFQKGETVVSYVSVDDAGNKDSTAFTITVSDNEAPLLTAMAMDTTAECAGLTDTTDLDAWLANHGGAVATDNCDSLAWTHNYAGDCAVEVGDFNTHQQGGWGSTSGGVHDNLNNNFDAIFPSGVTVGCSAGYEIVFTSADAIETYLPCTGNAESLVISHSGPDPEEDSDPTCWNNALVSQILTAKLNAQFDANLPAFSSSDLLLGDLVSTSGVFMGMSGNEIIAVADSIVGDCSTSYTLNEIKAVLRDFNRNYTGSQVDQGFFAPAACFYGNCGGTGTVTVEFTATDEAGNSSTTTASFTLEDTTPPTISAQDFTLALDSTGAATLTAADVDLGTADLCGFDTLTLSQTAFDCSHLGEVTVTINAVDDCGNTSTEDVTITVTDTIAPNITEADVSNITQDSDADVCTAVVTWTAPGTWDNCSGETLSYSHDPGSTFDVGVTTVTITVTDGSLNADSLTFDVTIEDNQVPTIASMTQVDAETSATTCDAVVTWTDPVTSDNCPGDTLTYSHDPGSTFALGTTEVTAYVTDDALNVDSVKFDVVVVDATDPMISDMPADTTLNNDAGLCGAALTWAEPSSSDNCPGETLIADYALGYTFPVGTTTVTYTATDAASNSVTESFDVTVEDNENPVITGTPIEITHTADADLCTADVFWIAPVFSDNCAGASMSSSHNPNDTFPIGVTTVTYTATDVAGNTDSTSFDVTITDDQDPVIAAMSDIAVNTAPGVCTQVVTWTPPAVSDNCAMDTLYSSHEPGATFSAANGGETTVTYTALDSTGNQSQISFKVTVSDNELPVITAASDTTAECAENNDDQLNDWVDNHGGATATDNCTGDLTWTNDFNSDQDLDWICGYTSAIVVTFTATDESLNSSTTTATFTIEDTTDPVFDQTLPSDTTVNCESVPAALTLTAQDVCSGDLTVSYVPDTVLGTCPQEYTINRNWSTTDDCGNSTTHTQVITVQDTAAPVITTQAMDSTLACDGTDYSADFASWRAAYGGATAADACGDITWTESYVMGSTCAGDSAQVTFTATDECGNFSTTTAIWKMEDVTAPMIVDTACSMIVECDGAGNVAAIQLWLDTHAGASATEECTNVTWTNDFTTMGMTCGNTSAVQVVFTASDSCGNYSQTAATFTIEDTTPPTFVEALPADGTFECDAVPTAETLTATDICGGSMPVTFDEDRTDGICPDSYTLVRTWTTADSCDNSTSHSQTLTIQDTTDPILVGKDFTLYLDESGEATLVADSLDNGSTDNCATPTFSADITSFDCDDLDDNTVLLTASDSCSNSTSANFTVTVLDTISPVFEDELGAPAVAQDTTVECTGQDYTVELNNWIANHAGALASDACGPITWTNTTATFVPDCGNSGSYPVTFTATDGSSNASSTTATFYITDTQPPVIASEAINVTVECDGNGNTEAMAAWVEAHGGAGIATDDCGDVTWTSNFQGFADICTGNSAVEVTFYASDDCGNVASTSSIFTIEDTTAPTLTTAAADSTVECDGLGNGSDFQAWLNNHGGATAEELCGSITWAADTLAITPGCATSGGVTIDFIASDDCGNSVSSSATFAIYDNTAPNALGQDVTVYLDANGLATISTDDIDNGSNDVCGDVTMSLDITSFDCDDVGSNPVVLTVMDACMNTASATFTVNVTALDSLAPSVANMPADTVLTADATFCSAVVNFVMPTIDDNCDGGSLTSSHSSGSAFPVGTTTVTFVVTDASQNADSTTFDITVTDDELPQFTGVPSNISVNSDAGVCTAAPTWVAPVASDNCEIATEVSSHEIGDTFELGITTVTYTATDNHGNVDSVSFTIEVKDAEKPAILGLPADIAQANDLGDCSAAVTWTVPTMTDNCETDTLVSSHQSGDVFPVGSTVVTYTASDAAGNDSIATFTVTINDTETPGIENLPADITQSNDEDVCGAVVTWGGFDSVTDSYIDVEESDNCPGASISSTHNSGDTFPVGVTTVTFTATDAAGNDSIASFTVTITDDQDPDIFGMPVDFSQTADADDCGALVSWTPPTSSDNCTGDTLATSHEVGSYFEVGTTTVTYTATDSVGNDSIASFVITVTDDQAPAINGLPGDLTASNDIDSCGAVMTWSAPTPSDNCDVDTLYSSHASGDYFPVGSTTVTYTAEDIHGNSTDSTFVITINDTQDPEITAASDETVECDGSGNTSALNAWLANYGGAVATDNCEIASVTDDYDPSNMTDSCGMTGAVFVTFTAMDNAGNTATTSATFIIEDTTPPSFEPEGESVVVECDGSGNAAQLSAWLSIWDSGITVNDDCGSVAVSKTSTLLTDECGATGQATVTFVATDACGNEADTTMTFTIEDTTPPTLLTTADDLTVECDGAGNQAAFDAWLASHAGATAEDVCGNYTWSNDFIDLTDECGETGRRTVTFTATDECGNHSYTSATFTIEDTTPPTIASAAVNMTVECDGAGNLAALNGWLASNGGAGAAADVCGSYAWSHDFTALSDDCGETGFAAVTFTVTDDCGLTNSTTATFTIEDTTNPTIASPAQDLIVECDGNGNPTDLNAWLDANGGAGAVTETCGDFTWSHDFVALSDDCGATGAATVTFTVTDDCGLTATTSATFTIEDKTDPSMDVPSSNLTVECDGNGNLEDLNGWLTSNGGASATDICSGVTWSNDHVSVSDLCGATGSTTVTFTATDECNNSTPTTATFTIEDNTAPVLSGNEIVIIDCSQWPWDALYEPTIDELLTVVDTAGNPMITLDESCGYTNFPIDFGVMSGGCSYDHQLIYHPVDDCGNEGDSLYQVIQVDDFSDPVFTSVPADTMIACTENVMAYLEMATAVDACDPSVNMTFEDEVIPTACPEEYTIRRTFYAEDCGYNIAEAVQTITVSDTAAPTLALTAPADVTIYGCLASADMTVATNGEVTWDDSDDCGAVSVTYTTSDANVYSCTADDAVEEGSHVVTRTFTVTAVDCAGNSTTESTDQTITIIDNEAPMATLTAPADTTIYLDATCFAADVAHPSSGDATGFLVDASDNCDSEVAHTIAHADDTTYTGIASGVGSFDILRTYSVTVVDDCGNDATETTSHMIHVMDTISPATSTDFPNDTIIYADNSNGYFDPTPSSTGGPSVDYSDNCSGSGESQYGAIGQSVPTGGLIITAIGDPNDAASTCRFVEIHNSSDADIDMSGYALQRWTNAGATPATSNNVDLSPLGTLEPGEYAHISNSAGFEGCYGFASSLVGGGSGPVGSNGDDNIAIINSSSDIIDLFGVIGEDGSNTCHDFEDGVALRAGTNTDPNGGAWDEAGWIVYSDFSNASGCTNHNSSQQQNAADIAPLLNNWAGAGEAPVETDFNDADISFADETTSYTASACYTFERTWTVTVTDNNGNATTTSSVQTIAVSDTTSPVITADAATTAACDLFGFDLSAGDESNVLAGTSFEQAASGEQYVDTGDADEDHALANNAGQSVVNFSAANGEMGFTSQYYTNGGVGLTDGDFVGVSSYTGTVGSFTDGGQGFQMSDVDGIMEVTFDAVDVSSGGVTLSIDAFLANTGWENSGPVDEVRIWVVADGGEVDLLNSNGQDIDDLEIEGDWETYTLDLDGYASAELHVSFSSNSGSEALFIDNISFSQGSSPLAALMANGYVSFSDNVELANTGASITLDGTPCEGAYDIVYSATDSCGNASSMSQRIELVDTVNPVLTVNEPNDTTLYADADCFADFIDGVPYPAASATDNCDADVEIEAYHADGAKQYSCLPSTGAFSVLRTYTTTATDNCGNEHIVQVNRLITVLDTIKPTFNVTAPAALSVNIDALCSVNTSTTIGGEPTITDVNDNCDIDVQVTTTHVDSAPVYTCSDADGTAEGSYTFVRTFTITASDDCGNETIKTVMQDITATDVTPPVITAVPAMAEEVFNLDADCFADLTPTASPIATATDACDSDVTITSTYLDGAPSYTCSDSDGEAEGSFSFTRTWTVSATDDCNNTSTQETTQLVSVVDGLAPSLSATWPADYTADLDADCAADLSISMAGEATATGEDACDSDVEIVISYADHDTTLLAVNVDTQAEGGYTFTRTWTATSSDDCGNETTETHDQVITANDVMAPTQTLETLPTYMVEGCYGDVDLSPATTGTPNVTAEDACDSELDIDVTYTTDDLAFNEVMGNYSLVIDTISGPEEGIIGSTTVRMYIETENEGDFVSAVAGDVVNPTGIRTTTSFYQNSLGANTANNLSALLLAADPMLAYDSWVTIGIEEAPSSADGELETSTIGDWDAGFGAGGNLLISDFFGGSWYTTFPNSAAEAGDDHRVLLGQFTTDGQMSGQLFVQVFPNGVGADEMRLSFTFGDCAEDDDTPEGSYSFTRRWESVVTDDANNQDTAVNYQHIMVLDTEAPQLTNTCDLENGEEVLYDCPGAGVLDFDPVPTPCDVTAIDNCDSEVNVNLFTETQGHIPTDLIRNYCAPTTPEAQGGAQTCDDRAPEVLRLFNFPGMDDSFVMAGGESLVQVMSDGSMSISLEVENADGTGGFIMTAAYGAGQDWNTWQAGGSNYKKDCAEIYPGEAVWEDWVYFLMTSGDLEGTGMYAGSSFTLSHQPANGYYGMQMGLGANNKNTNYGGSAWFFWQGNLFMDGVDMGPMASSGDVYMDLDCCLEWNVDYFYTALDDCGNPTGFSYSEGMGSDIGSSDPGVSGGHTVGPVDITSAGGIKEPIRITGLAPNPTNDQSQLTFVVNQNMRLRVDLYTMDGMLVQELYQGNAVTGVQYMMDIDADALSAGMYQVRVSSNIYLAVKKLLVAD